MSLQINYIDAPEGAQKDLQPSSTGGNAFSRDSLLASGGGSDIYATLEKGLWTLDGSRKLLGAVPENMGWWSAVCSDEDGFLNPVPRITLVLPVPYTSTGFTFTFAPQTGQWCSHIYVRWFNGQNKITEGDYYPDAPCWTLNNTVESFDRVEIDLLKTNRPIQLAKLRRIEIGRTILFEGDELLSVGMVNEVDPSLCVLSADTMTVELIDNYDRELIPQENQRMELVVDGVVRGVQYIVSSSRESRSRFKISCQSVIGLLEDTFLGGIFREIPLAELVNRIVPNFKTDFSPLFADTTVSGYLPVCSQREALQQIGFAVGAVISTQSGDGIRFLDVPAVTSGVFRESDIFLGGSVKTSPRVAKVMVYAHSYKKDDLLTTVVNEEEIHGTDVLITFDKPHHDYRITGGTITGSGENWITVTADGIVTVEAKGYDHISIPHVRRNSAAVAREQSNFVAVSDVTLVGEHNAEAALDRLFSVYQLRQTTQQRVAVNGQKAGDLVASMTPWGVQTRGFISSMDSRFTQNGQTAAIYIQGVEAAPAGVWNYAGEMFAGEQEVLCG